jgi:pSer/pThr/pTyr-binding forkhead associated (FHA) protein
VELRARLAAERAGGCFLVLRDGEGRQHIVSLTDRPVTVGRGPEADVRLRWDDQVSRAHAEIARVGGAWTVVDDGLSTNGTFCNDERVRGRRRLADGDQLRFGHTIVAFRAPTLKDSVTTAMADEAPGITLTDTQRRVLVALCRPLRDNAYATPATNRRIADEVFLGVDAVKVHLRALYRKLGIGAMPQNEKRARLVELAFHLGLVDAHDLAD